MRSSTVLLATLDGAIYFNGVLPLSRARARERGGHLFLVHSLRRSRIVDLRLLTRLYHIKVRLSFPGYISASVPPPCVPDISFSQGVAEYYGKRGTRESRRGLAVKGEDSRSRVSTTGWGTPFLISSGKINSVPRNESRVFACASVRRGRPAGGCIRTGWGGTVV